MAVSAYVFVECSPGKALARLDDVPQTVEHLIEQGYFAAPLGEPVTSILYDKKHISWLGLDDHNLSAPSSTQRSC